MLSFSFLLVGYLLPLICILLKNKTSVTLEANSDTDSEPCQTSRMEVFTKVVKGFSFLVICTISSILGDWQDSGLPCEPKKDIRKKLHLRCLAGSWIYPCISYFRKTFAYLFTKFDEHLPPYIKQDSSAHGQIYVTLISTYLSAKWKL